MGKNRAEPRTNPEVCLELPGCTRGSIFPDRFHMVPSRFGAQDVGMILFVRGKNILAKWRSVTDPFEQASKSVQWNNAIRPDPQALLPSGLV